MPNVTWLSDGIATTWPKGQGFCSLFCSPQAPHLPTNGLHPFHPSHVSQGQWPKLPDQLRDPSMHGRVLLAALEGPCSGLVFQLQTQSALLAVTSRTHCLLLPAQSIKQGHRPQPQTNAATVLMERARQLSVLAPGLLTSG